MSSVHKHQVDAARVLAKATLRAADELGIRQNQLKTIIGRDPSSINRNGIDPTSKAGELSKLFIRCYRSLAVLVDENGEQMRHWLTCYNHHTQGVPIEQMTSIIGLTRVCEYLDAVRGKV